VHFLFTVRTKREYSLLASLSYVPHGNHSISGTTCYRVFWKGGGERERERIEREERERENRKRREREKREREKAAVCSDKEENSECDANKTTSTFEKKRNPHWLNWYTTYRTSNHIVHQARRWFITRCWGSVSERRYGVQPFQIPQTNYTIETTGCR
jgi:hypothetical protein